MVEGISPGSGRKLGGSFPTEKRISEDSCASALKVGDPCGADSGTTVANVFGGVGAAALNLRKNGVAGAEKEEGFGNAVGRYS